LSNDGDFRFAYDPMFDNNNWGMVENTVQAQLDEEVLSSETTVDYRVPAGRVGRDVWLTLYM